MHQKRVLRWYVTPPPWCSLHPLGANYNPLQNIKGELVAIIKRVYFITEHWFLCRERDGWGIMYEWILASLGSADISQLWISSRSEVVKHLAGHTHQWSHLWLVTLMSGPSCEWSRFYVVPLVRGHTCEWSHLWVVPLVSGHTCEWSHLWLIPHITVQSVELLTGGKIHWCHWWWHFLGVPCDTDGDTGCDTLEVTGVTLVVTLLMTLSRSHWCHWWWHYWWHWCHWWWHSLEVIFVGRPGIQKSLILVLFCLLFGILLFLLIFAFTFSL